MVEGLDNSCDRCANHVVFQDDSIKNLTDLQVSECFTGESSHNGDGIVTVGKEILCDSQASLRSGRRLAKNDGTTVEAGADLLAAVFFVQAFFGSEVDLTVEQVEVEGGEAHDVLVWLLVVAGPSLNL